MLVAGAIVGTVAVAGIAAAVSVKTYRAEKWLFFPSSPAQIPIDRAGMAGTEAIELKAAGFRLRGWYVPSKNRAAIVLAHGSISNRLELLKEAQALSRAGFGILMFDWPGHGESEGKVQWAANERECLSAAIDFAAARPDTDAKKLGAMGHSMGGYVVAQVAATDQRLKAVVLVNAPAVQREQVAFQYGSLGPLGTWPALLALKEGGMKVDERRPLDEVSKISPRSLLLIAGTDDTLVPSTMARDMYNAASAPKSLYMIEGAGHNDWAEVAGQPYFDRLVNFFDTALLGKKD